MMRQAALQTVVDRLQDAFTGAELSAPARAALDRLFKRLETPASAARPAGESLPVTALFPAALASVPDALTPLADALAALSPGIAWTTSKKVGPTASAGFPKAHANAMLIGPGGLELRDDVWIGLSLMAPNTRYPDHDHAPEEVYLVLSDGAFLQGDADWLPRRPGETVYNTPGIRHAMRAGDQTLLALWCLPV